MTPVLVFGKTGQVAQSLYAQHPEFRFLSRAEADLSDPEACVAVLDALSPAAVINAAAYTAVDRAEDDEDVAQRINGDTPGALARACAARDIPFVHISTDYVFDGSGTAPWTPQDATNPLGAYGRTKLAGEDAIRAAGGRYAILRTSWVFSAYGANFVKSMLRLGAERDALTVVADQIGGPTAALDIAAACARIASQLAADATKTGTYHFSGAPAVSWADFAREIFKRANLNCQVTDIPSSAYPTRAQRPGNSRMDCALTQTQFDLSQPDWRQGLDIVLKELSSDDQA